MNLDAGIIEVNVDEIVPNKAQPRTNFDEKSLIELAESIKQHGIIQPLVLRKLENNYELIAGERRHRAAKLAGLTKVPAVIANIDDNASAEVALVENIQRKDLSAIEEARSYKNLLDRGYLTQEDLASRLGLSQSAISNKLRLLNLATPVQDALLEERISERHARTLLKLEKEEDQIEWLNKIIRERLTVRQLEMEIKKVVSTPEETFEVPLVELTPDIDLIKETATDINPEPAPKIVEDFFPEQQPEVNLQEQTIVADVHQETPRKFFNFLEDEEANLSTEEPEVQQIQEEPAGVQVIDFETPEQPTLEPNMEPSVASPIEITPLEEQPEANNEVSFFDLPKETIETPQVEEPQIINTPSSTFEELPTFENINQTPVAEPINISNEPIEFNQPVMEPTMPEIQIEEQPEEIAQPIIDLTEQTQPEEIAPNNNIFFENKDDNQPIVDPVNIIEQLDPKYEERKKALQGLDLKTAINLVRDVTREIEDRGFTLEVDEIDFENSYHISIKIDKNNN